MNNATISTAAKPEVTTGDDARATTFDALAHAVTAGFEACASTFGALAHAVTAGIRASAATAGKNSVAVALGQHSSACAEIGGWIVVAAYDRGGDIVAIRSARIDGEKLKPGVYYRLDENGFVEADSAPKISR